MLLVRETHYRSVMLSREVARRGALFAVLLGITLVVGCAPVRAWERGTLSSPAMEQRLGEQGTKGSYRAKVLESKTGGGLPGDAPGGGCGCTQ
jgi:hypothetical protein